MSSHRPPEPHGGPPPSNGGPPTRDDGPQDRGQANRRNGHEVVASHGGPRAPETVKAPTAGEVLALVEHGGVVHARLCPAGPPVYRVPCPDCAGDLALDVHDDGCPLHDDVEAMREADRAFFVKYPRATGYWRGPWPCERATLLAVHGMTSTPAGWQWTGRVFVEQLEPGVRRRHVADLCLRPPAGGRS